MTKLPGTYTFWKHKKSSKIYVLTDIANQNASPERKDEYPTLAVYKDRLDGQVWAQPLDKFLEKMEQM